MKSIVINRYGPADVMELAEVDRPGVSGQQVLVRVMYTSVNPLDWKIRKGMLRFMTGGRFPITLGQDVAGVVEETGPDVRRFARGDRVFGMLDQRRRGAYAEYAVAAEPLLAPIPEGVGFREAAAVPLASLTAWRALHDMCGIKKGDTVLINGASGGVGTFAVQFAGLASATVTAVCGSSNLELVRSLGADEAVDYTRQDVTHLPGRYDIIFDVAGRLSFFSVKGMLKQNGRYVTTLPGGPAGVLGLLVSPVLYLLGYGKRAMMVFVKPDGARLERIGRMMADGRLRPVIDREYALSDIVEAHRYSEAGHARGKIVVRI